MEKSHLTFITGGVRSGKSSFAERIATDVAKTKNASLHYIATAQATDPEMETRIKKHRKDREDAGAVWQTWEKETDIISLSARFTKNDVILLDCLTTLLSNELFAHDMGTKVKEIDKQQVFQNIIDGIFALQASSNQLILVSNEVLNEPVEANEFVRLYCELLGKLHQKIVQSAESVYLVEGGIPLIMKGEKP